MSAISPGAIPLSKDINGHRVVLYCLKHFATEDIKVTCFRDYGSHLVLIPGNQRLDNLSSNYSSFYKQCTYMEFEVVSFLND